MVEKGRRGEGGREEEEEGTFGGGAFFLFSSPLSAKLLAATVFLFFSPHSLFIFFPKTQPPPPLHPPRRFVLTQFNSHELNAHVARAYPPALFGGPAQQGFVDVLACHQTAENSEWAKGSADAVRRHLRQIMDPVSGAEPPSHVLITSGTAVTTLRYSDLIEAHKRSGADVTLATQSVPAEGAWRRGLLAVAPAEDGGSRAAGGNSGSDGRVMAFKEKPEGAALDAFAGASPWTSGRDAFEASMGVYVFRADALRALLAPRRVGGNTVATTIASVVSFLGGSNRRHAGAERERERNEKKKKRENSPFLLFHRTPPPASPPPPFLRTATTTTTSTTSTSGSTSCPTPSRPASTSARTTTAGFGPTCSRCATSSTSL